MQAFLETTAQDARQQILSTTLATSCNTPRPTHLCGVGVRVVPPHKLPCCKDVSCVLRNMQAARRTQCIAGTKVCVLCAFDRRIPAPQLPTDLHLRDQVLPLSPAVRAPPQGCPASGHFLPHRPAPPAQRIPQVISNCLLSHQNGSLYAFPSPTIGKRSLRLDCSRAVNRLKCRNPTLPLPYHKTF